MRIPIFSCFTSIGTVVGLPGRKERKKSTKDRKFPTKKKDTLRNHKITEK